MIEWKKALVSYFLGRRPSFQMVEGSVRKMWKIKYGFQVKTMGNGVFLFSFDCDEEKQKVLQGGSLHIARNPLILRQLNNKMDLSKPHLERVSLWVTFPGLPLHLWTQEGLNQIASVLGNPFFADKPTKTRS